MVNKIDGLFRELTLLVRICAVQFVVSFESWKIYYTHCLKSEMSYTSCIATILNVAAAMELFSEVNSKDSVDKFLRF